MNSRPSLAGRAALSLALMIGFYALAVGIAAGLLYLPYAEMTYAHRVHLKLLLFSLVGAGVILWSIFPRPDRFAAPGPALARERQPRLFDVLEGVAGATEQAMPVEVYLVPAMNAWVAQRGGVMGFGSHRVMGLGLPLLQALSVSELRAVLAHEFGHYHGGDTKLGPWIYKTRAAIGRTLDNLSQHSAVLLKPFEWYGNLFLRLTHAVSRRQELTADELASRAVGARPLVSGLRKVHGAAMAFDPYWSGEVVPVVEAGFLPPLAEGFRRFVAVERIAGAIEKGIAQEIEEGRASPYDTHPPLRERIEAVRELPPGDVPVDDPPALTLLDGVDALERDLLSAMAGEERARALRPLAWEEAGNSVYAPLWEKSVRDFAAAFAGATLDSLPEKAASILAELDRTLPGDQEERRRRAVWLLGTAIAGALARAGCEIRALPGEPVFLVAAGGEAIDPFAAASALSKGETSPNDWHERCARLGHPAAALDAV